MGVKSRALGFLALSGLWLYVVTGATAQITESVDGSVTMANTDCAIALVGAQGEIGFGVEEWDGKSDQDYGFLAPGNGGSIFVVEVEIYGASSAPDDQCYVALDTNGLYHEHLGDMNSFDTTIIGRSNFGLPDPGLVQEGTGTFEVTLVSVTQMPETGAYTGTLEFTISNDEEVD